MSSQKGFHAFLWRQPSQIQYVPIIFSGCIDVRGIDSVGDMHDLVCTKATDHGVAHELAGANEFVDAMITADHRVVPGLGPQQCTSSKGAVRTTLLEQRLEAAVRTLCADLAVAQLSINRAHRLVIMQSEYDWNTG